MEKIMQGRGIDNVYVCRGGHFKVLSEGAI